MVTCNEAHLMAIIYRETFQVVTVVDKYLPSATIMGEVVDSSSKSGNPDTSFHVLIDTIYIVVTQAVDIICYGNSGSVYNVLHPEAGLLPIPHPWLQSKCCAYCLEICNKYFP